MRYSEAKKRIQFMKNHHFISVKTEDGRYYYRELFFNQNGRNIANPFESGKLEDGTIKCVIKTPAAKVFKASNTATLKRELIQEMAQIKRGVNRIIKERGVSSEKR